MRLYSGVFAAARTTSSRGTGVRESIYLSIYQLGIHVKHVLIKALQTKTRRRKFGLRLSTSGHLLENLKQNNWTFSKTCAF